MNRIIGAVAIAAAMALAGAASAEGGQNVFYSGIGMAPDDPAEVDAMPYSFGFLHLSDTSQFVFGADLGGEGTMLDSTWGDNALRQAMSFNVILGGNITRSDRFRLDAGVLLGMRESFADCPDSYLGFQCYADFPPDTEYEANFGGIANASFGKLTVGLRITGESTQLITGMRF